LHRFIGYSWFDDIARLQISITRLTHLTGTHAGGFVLSRQEAAGTWGAATYAYGARDRRALKP
jgi:hypothetical protein